MPKRVGLIDVDSKYKTHGNLALMKISSYHKQRGDKVEWAAGPLYVRNFDTIYASSLFTTSTKDIPNNAIIGGPGFIDEGITDTLPLEIENSEPDYSLYPHLNFSYQRYSKGCANGCPFCIIPELEGRKTYDVDPMPLNPIGEYIYLLDSNFFAAEHWRWSIEHLRKCKQPVHWEGVDIRILTTEMLLAIFSMPLKGRIHIAWDNPREAINKRIAALIPEKLRRYVMCYVLIGFNSKPEEDLYRVETLRTLGVDPFVMPYVKNNSYQRAFARWANHKAIFNSVPFSEYSVKVKRRQPCKLND